MQHFQRNGSKLPGQPQISNQKIPSIPCCSTELATAGNLAPFFPSPFSFVRWFKQATESQETWRSNNRNRASCLELYMSICPVPFWQTHKRSEFGVKMLPKGTCAKTILAERISFPPPVIPPVWGELMHQLSVSGWQKMRHPLLAVCSAKQLQVHCQVKSTGLEQVKVTIFFQHPQWSDPTGISVGIWDF